MNTRRPRLCLGTGATSFEGHARSKTTKAEVKKNRRRKKKDCLVYRAFPIYPQLLYVWVLPYFLWKGWAVKEPPPVGSSVSQASKDTVLSRIRREPSKRDRLVTQVVFKCWEGHRH